MRSNPVTDEQVEKEIAELEKSPFVKLAKREQNEKRRQRLYNLRWLEKRGRELAEKGITDNESLNEYLAVLDDSYFED